MMNETIKKNPTNRKAWNHWLPLCHIGLVAILAQGLRYWSVKVTWFVPAFAVKWNVAGYYFTCCCFQSHLSGLSYFILWHFILVFFKFKSVSYVRGNNQIPWVLHCKTQGKVQSSQQSSVALLEKAPSCRWECPPINPPSLGTTNHCVGQPHRCWGHCAAPVLWWDMAWQLREGSSMVWSRAGLCSLALGFHGTALCPSDAQPCSSLTVSTGTSGLPQACAAPCVSSGPWAVGAPRWGSFAVTSSVQAFLRTGAYVWDVLLLLHVGWLWTNLLQEKLSEAVKFPMEVFHSSLGACLAFQRKQALCNPALSFWRLLTM